MNSKIPLFFLKHQLSLSKSHQFDKTDSWNAMKNELLICKNIKTQQFKIMDLFGVFFEYFGNHLVSKLNLLCLLGQ